MADYPITWIGVWTTQLSFKALLSKLCLYQKSEVVIVQKMADVRVCSCNKYRTDFVNRVTESTANGDQQYDIQIILYNQLMY